MRTTCRVCLHPERDKIEAQLKAGAVLRKLAAQYGLQHTGLFRHGKNHLAGPQQEQKQEPNSAETALEQSKQPTL